MVFEKVRELLAEQMSLDKDQITMETDIIADLGADSLDLVEVVMGLEEAFDLVIVDDEINSIHTVADVVSFIENQLG